MSLRTFLGCQSSLMLLVDSRAGPAQILAAVERVPGAQDCPLIAPFLRVFPSLEHPLIRRLPNAGRLREITQWTGPALVVVTSANRHLRQFIVTAMGHTLEQAARGQTARMPPRRTGSCRLRGFNTWSSTLILAQQHLRFGRTQNCKAQPRRDGLSRQDTAHLVETIEADRRVLVGWRGPGVLPAFPGPVQFIQVQGRSLLDMKLHLEP